MSAPANLNLPRGRTGNLLALGLLVLFCGIVWFAVAEPMIGWYDSRAEHLTEQTMLAQRMRDIAGQLPDLKREASRFDATRVTKGAFVQGATDAIAGAALEQNLQAMATQTGATLSSAEILPPQQAGGYARIQLRVAVSGSWPVLIGLLQAIGADQPALLVDNLQISGVPDIGPPGTAALNAMFTVIAFRAATVHPDANGRDPESSIAP